VVTGDHGNVKIPRRLIGHRPIRIGDRDDLAPCVATVPRQVRVARPGTGAKYGDSYRLPFTHLRSGPRSWAANVVVRQRPQQVRRPWVP
jgi:hypothetical protein